MSFTYSRPLTITTHPGSTLTNFPVLVSVTNAALKTVSNGGHVQDTNGYDICFAADAANATPYFWEMESYDGAAGTVVAWVRIPSVSSSVDTVFYMLYGDSGISTFQSTASSVWDANYKGVWHLAAGLNVNDSTSGANNGTNHSATATTAKIGGGAAFNGTTQYIDLGNNANLKTALPVTVSLWVNKDAAYNGASNWAWFSNDAMFGFSAYNGIVLGDDTSGHIEIDFGDGNTPVAASARRSKIGATALATATDYYITAVYRGAADMTIYVNGVDDNGSYSGTGGALAYTTHNGSIGVVQGASNDGFFKGKFDEFRFSSIERSAAWVAAEYANQNSPGTYYTLGAESGGASTFAAAGTGAFSGSGAASTTGNFASAGIGAANPVGISGTVLQASGIGAFAAVGASIASSPASSAGVGAVAMVGAASVTSVFSAAGTGSLSSVGIESALWIFNDGATYPWYANTYKASLYITATRQLWRFWEAWDAANSRRLIKVRVGTFSPTFADGPKYTVGVSPLVDDDHGVMCCEQDHQGYVWTLWGSHNTASKIAVTTAPNDPSAWTAKTDITIPDGLTYPHLVRVGTQLYCYFRRAIGAGSQKVLCYIKGTPNNGSITWSSPVDLGDYGANTWFYQGTTRVRNTTEVHFVSTRAHGPDDAWRRDIHYLIHDTTDDSFKNFDRSFSTANASLPITITDLNAQYRIVTQPTPTGTGNIPVLDFDAANNPWVLYCDGAIGGTMTIYATTVVAGAWAAGVSVGVTNSRYSQFGISQAALGGMTAWFSKTAGAFTDGGDMYKSTKPVGGAWGAHVLVRAAGSRSFNEPQAIHNGPPNARAIYTENTQLSVDSGAGGLKGYMEGDAGPLIDGVSSGASGGSGARGLGVKLGLGL